MKPRLFDGEHAVLLQCRDHRFHAAMKPRLFDGEHPPAGRRRRAWSWPQ